MKKIFYLIVLCLLLGVMAYILSPRRQMDQRATGRISLAAPDAPPRNSTAKAAKDNPKSIPNEDDDILAFVKQILTKVLNEDLALKLLHSNMSQNKKAVVLETFRETGRVFQAEEWDRLLLSFIETAEQWPELANQAARALELRNRDGHLNHEILDTWRRLSPDAELKRAAALSALSGKEALAEALTTANLDLEFETLARKEALLLSSEELAFRISQARGPAEAQVYYWRRNLELTKHPEIFQEELAKALKAQEFSSLHMAHILMAAGQSATPGKTRILHELWRRSVAAHPRNPDFIEALNLGLGQSIYSDADEAGVRQFFQALQSVAHIKDKETDDPLVDLALLIAHTCRDISYPEAGCRKLARERRELNEILKASFFAEYL